VRKSALFNGALTKSGASRNVGASLIHGSFSTRAQAPGAVDAIANPDGLVMPAHFNYSKTSDGILLHRAARSSRASPRWRPGHFFSIGGQRWEKVVKAAVEGIMPNAERRGKHNAVSNGDVRYIIDFLDGLDKEEGFPCQHKRPCQHVAPWNDAEGIPATVTWKDIHKKHIAHYKAHNADCAPKDLAKTWGFCTWLEWVRRAKPSLFTSRKHFDLCDVCEKTRVALISETDPAVREEEPLHALNLHKPVAMAQRKAASETVRKVMALRDPKHSSVDFIDFTLDVDDVITEPASDAQGVHVCVCMCVCVYACLCTPPVLPTKCLPGGPRRGGRAKKLLTIAGIELAPTNERGPCANHWASLLVEMQAPVATCEPPLPRHVPV
jgi:hypothetical protein